MARYRELRQLQIGEYNGAALWSEGTGLEALDRAAEDIGIKVADKWVYLYLHDGKEVVKLSRTRNHTAQVYPGMSLRDVMREREKNYLNNSSGCCRGRYAAIEGGDRSVSCETHTAEWLDAEADKEVLARKRKEEQQQRAAINRDINRARRLEPGAGIWTKGPTGGWLVQIQHIEPVVGSVITVITAAGQASEVVIDSATLKPKLLPGHVDTWLCGSHPATPESEVTK